MIVWILGYLHILSCRSENKDNVAGNHTLAKTQKTVDSFVFDNVGLLNSEEQKYLINKLSHYYHENNIAVLCVITETIKPFEEEMDYGDFIVRTYEEEFKNLVVIVMFTEDRRIIIKKNKETRKIYSDARCRQILKEFMAPRFKKGAYFQGLESGINELINKP